MGGVGDGEKRLRGTVMTIWLIHAELKAQLQDALSR